MKVYLASSWRNERYPAMLTALRDAGHEVYDFRNPRPDNDGFRWSAIVPGMTDALAPAEHVVTALAHPIAEQGFAYDREALEWCDTLVMALPCGKSAHYEAGYASGQGKNVAIWLDDPTQPELMYLLADFRSPSLEAIVEWATALDRLEPGDVIHTGMESGIVNAAWHDGFRVFWPPSDQSTYEYPWPDHWKVERRVEAEARKAREMADFDAVLARNKAARS